MRVAPHDFHVNMRFGLDVVDIQVAFNDLYANM